MPALKRQGVEGIKLRESFLGFCGVGFLGLDNCRDSASRVKPFRVWGF